MIHLKPLVLGKKIQHLIGFEEELDLNPHMAVKGEPLIYELMESLSILESTRKDTILLSLEGGQLGISATTPTSPQLPCMTF